MVASVKHARVRNSTQCICDKHLYLFIHQDTSFGFPPSLDLLSIPSPLLLGLGTAHEETAGALGPADFTVKLHLPHVKENRVSPS